MNNRLIVLSGEAGAGKDSVANILVNEHGWQAYSIAAPLKRFAQDLFEFSDEQVYGPSSARNAPDPRWQRPCVHCKSTGKVRGMIRIRDCFRCEGTGMINDNSPRRVLQLLGEEYLRQMIHPDALTIRARADISRIMHECEQRGAGGVVVTDARNDNDRDNLHVWLGGARVHVSAPAKPRKNDAWRMHASEQRQPTPNQVEYWLENDESWPFPTLPSKVRTMLALLNTR